MFWELSSLIGGIGDEYRGFRKFKQATGAWPWYSIVASLLSIPLLFSALLFGGLLCSGSGTHRLPVIYVGLVGGVICCATTWYGVRRMACKADVATARRSGVTPIASKTLEEFIR